MMDDCIIEGNDTIISDEEIVINWDIKMSRKIVCKLCICKNENFLEDILKEYVGNLQKQALHFKMKKLLQQKILKHVMVFYSCCLSFKNIPSEMPSYWENMQNVLVILCNLELDLTKNLKVTNNKEYSDNVEEVTTRLVYILSVFLLNDNQKICHVLLKLDMKTNSKQSRDVMRGVYRHFLVMMPIKDKSDENFCRVYLLFKSFKDTMNKKNHKAMDSLLFTTFGRTEESISNSRKLRKILLPSTHSIIDVVDMLSDYRELAIENYFRHIEEKNREEDLCIPSSINLESDSDEDIVEVVTTAQNKTVMIVVDDDNIVKLEDDESEDQARKAFINGIICLDDDSDVEEVTVSFEPSKIREILNPELSCGSLSFLDSIKIPSELTSVLETPPPSAQSEPVAVLEEPSQEKTAETTSSTTLPFIESYLDNLRIQGQVIDVNQPSFSETMTENTENVTESCTVTTPNDKEIEVETVSANQMESESLIMTVEVESESVSSNVQNVPDISATSNCNDKENEISVSGDIFLSKEVTLSNLTEKVPESTVEPSLLVLDKELEMSIGTPPTVLDKESNSETTNSDGPNSDVDNPCNDLIETTEKPLDSPNGYNFNLLHGLITPPVSDRTNDDAVSDLNSSTNCAQNVYLPHIIRIDHIPYEEFETNCALIEKSLSEIPLEVNAEDEHQENNDGNAGDLNESQGDLQINTDDTLALHESIDIQESDIDQYSANSTIIDNLAGIDDGHSNVGLDEANPSIFDRIDAEHELASENLTPVDIIVEDYQLPSSDIISTNEHLLKKPVDCPVFSSATTNEKFTDIVTQKHNFIPNKTVTDSVHDNSPPFRSILKNSNKTNNNNHKILTIKNDHITSRFNVACSTKVNGDIVKNSKPALNFDKNKIIFTSNERVSAPLALFSKFEQAQSELVEGACSGPIQAISMYSSIHSDHSNSSDGLYSPPLPRPITADSPISPPYEQIQAQDYENHVRSVKYNCTIKNMDPNDPTVGKTKGMEETQKELQRSDSSKSTSIIEKTSNRKRKHDSGTQPTKKNKVNFGPTEVRTITPVNLQLVDSKLLQEADASMQRYNITVNDLKLLYLRPKIPIKIESLSELEEKEEQLKIRSLINNAAAEKLNDGRVFKRVDYNKTSEPTNSAITSPPEIRHNISNLISRQRENVRLENPVPSGYVPPINGYSSVHGLQSSNAMEQKQNFNNHQQNQTSTFNDNCNSEILNLSISSALNTITELDNPESEFSRSPKLLQNSDQIVQRCLTDNLDNNEVEPIIKVPNDMVLFSNNSNFYSTSSQVKLPNTLPTLGACQSESGALNEAYDKYKTDLEELLLKNELDKLFDEKLNNCENETSLPLKKRRVVPKLNETITPFKEISYPATPMMSIAEIEALSQSCNKNNRGFKTAAERKEMPPIPLIFNRNSSEPTPIIADQFNINNHTYNNPTINYHMNNVPVPFINVPCAPYYSFPPFIVPFNNVTPYDSNLNQDCTPCKKEEEQTKVTKTVKKQKKEKKKQFTKSKEFFQQFVSDKKFIF